MNQAREIIKEELACAIENMTNVKKQAGKDEWLAIEESTLTILRTLRFLVDELERMRLKP